MDNTAAHLQQEITTLTEHNEALLKSKSKLQQEVLLLKRQLITQDKNIKLIDNQETSLSTQNRLLAEKENEIAGLLLQAEQLQNEIQDLRKEIEHVTEENLRLRKLKWYQLLMGKK
jgi:predicted  nucleic acid-binding Zn-ribbon protein